MSRTFVALRRSALSLLLLVFSLSLSAQQPNSPDASLLINGMSGFVPLAQGDPYNLTISGAPNRSVLLWVGSERATGLSTPYGLVDVWPIDAFLWNAFEDPSHATDGSGALSWSNSIPWLMPVGQRVAAQGAVEDWNSPAGFSLTARTVAEIMAGNTAGQHLFFDPLTGAKGRGHILPPSGTLPGDLPTLGLGSQPGPSFLSYNGQPVHNVFQNSFKCAECHNVPQVWDSYQGTMMANSARDPLFKALFAIAVESAEFLHQNGVIGAGGEMAADYCIRCHQPNAWNSGRSGHAGDGVTVAYHPDTFDHQHGIDMEGVSCDACHRATETLPPQHPLTLGLLGNQPENAQIVFSPEPRTKLGPYPGSHGHSYQGNTSYGALVPPAQPSIQPVVPHVPGTTEGTAASPWHRTEQSALHGSSELCAGCHNITNPVTGHAIERTYTEWLNSSYGDPQSPDFQSCQDCHLPQDPGNVACTKPGSHPLFGSYSKVRTHMRSHEYVGGNAWIPQILKQMYPNVDQPWVSGQNYESQLYAGPASRDAMWDLVTSRAYAMMKRSAEVDLTASETTPGTIDAQVTITNLSGHKLPTGYPEGRQMWIDIQAVDANGQPFYRVGELDSQSRLVPHQDLKVYEAEHGLDYPSLGLHGPSFHFFMNNVPHKDNRILPKGAVQLKGLGGTDSYDPATHPYPQGGLYPDGQHWDTTSFSIPVPPGTARPIKVVTTVYYQTVSREFIEFLANGGDSTVSTLPHPDALTLLNLWDNGFPAPAVPVGRVGAGSNQDPQSATPDQTAMVLLP